MPIRINLLAEAQSAEELRRKDPTKRAIYVAACLVVMVLVWMSSLQVKIMADKAHLSNLEARLSSHTNAYNQILVNKHSLVDVKSKLEALNRLAANRFLNAPLLDALMHGTVDGIQITHFRMEQSFIAVPEVAPIMERGHSVGGKPAGSLERNKLVLDAKDTSPNPGNDAINHLKETLAHSGYFTKQQVSTNEIMLKNLSTPQLDPDSGKPYVLFSLELNYPDHER
ncbi:MAG TPA: hypothetical protein VH413_12215 [Verrucomicrobiae bacterium]|jgi:hypothetical protein|nr:hypothetical protein [Verrucomicrobiae bacterium]